MPFLNFLIKYFKDGALESMPSDVEVKVIDTNSLSVSWMKHGDKTMQNIVKVFNGVTNELVVFEYVQDKSIATIKNILPGTRYRVIGKLGMNKSYM